MNVTIDTERRVSVNDNVDLLIRKVSITEAGDSPKTIEAVELREWLKNAEVEGHGLFIPWERRLTVANLLSNLPMRTT